jgi:hypothetical protein
VLLAVLLGFVACLVPKLFRFIGRLFRGLRGRDAASTTASV